MNVGGKELDDAMLFRCDRSLIESNGNADTAIEARLATARTMFNTMHPTWVAASARP